MHPSRKERTIFFLCEPRDCDTDHIDPHSFFFFFFFWTKTIAINMPTIGNRCRYLKVNLVCSIVPHHFFNSAFDLSHIRGDFESSVSVPRLSHSHRKNSFLFYFWWKLIPSGLLWHTLSGPDDLSKFDPTLRKTPRVMVPMFDLLARCSSFLLVLL